MANNYYEFRNPVVPGTRIVSARYNQDMASIAAGFDLLPDSGDLFLSLLGYGVATGTTPNVYNVTIPVGAPLTAYVTGMQVTFLADKTSTGAAQLNVNGLGNKLIVSSGTVGLPAGSIIAGSYYTLRFDGTNFQMQTALYALFDQAAASSAASAAAALQYRNTAQSSAADAAVSKSAAADSAAQAAASAAAALASANNASNSASSALTSASNASTSAGNASASAINAATSATQAQGFRNEASTFRTNAATSATNAANSAQSAANSAQAAANSAATISLPLAVTQGGTGAQNAVDARTNLGLTTFASNGTTTSEINGNTFINPLNQNALNLVTADPNGNLWLNFLRPGRDSGWRIGRQTGGGFAVVNDQTGNSALYLGPNDKIGMRETSSNGSTGWTMNPDTGIIRQWGRTPAYAAGNGTPVAFPMTFPNQCTGVTHSLIRSSPTSTGSSEPVYVGEPGRSGVQLFHGGGLTIGGFWEAFGY